MITFEAERDAPIACSMPVTEMGGRLREFHELFATHLRSMVRDPRRLQLVLDPADGLEPRVRDLLAREHECCPFADIVIRPHSNGLTVEIGVPEGAEGVLDGFAFIAETAAPGAAR